MEVEPRPSSRGATLELWRLLKDVRAAACMRAPHPLGVELRAAVFASRGAPAGALPPAHDLIRSEVFRDPDRAAEASAGWRARFESRGWRAPAPRFTRAALVRALALTEQARRRVPGDSAMGHVLSYRLKAMQEALEVGLDAGLSLDDAARERRLAEAMRELARAERGPEGRALVAPILEALA